jgi:hypothetical protein
VQCSGSSLFLKRHYGGGFQLTVEKGHGSLSISVSSVDEFIIIMSAFHSLYICFIDSIPFSFSFTNPF